MEHIFERIFYACKAGIKGGIARCQNEYEHCGSHPLGKEVPLAPRPNTILFKVKLGDNQYWKNWASIDKDFRLWSERRQLEADHVMEAEKLGRDAYNARPEQKRDKYLPESADSGCPVSGKTSGGWKSVVVSGLIAELREAGFVIANVSVLIMGTGQDARRFLTVAFINGRGAEEYMDFPWEKFNRLVSGSFAFVHVWANALQPDGECKHTVNCIGREPDGKRPEQTLHYNSGDWSLENNSTHAVIPSDTTTAA